MCTVIKNTELVEHKRRVRRNTIVNFIIYQRKMTWVKVRQCAVCQIFHSQPNNNLFNTHLLQRQKRQQMYKQAQTCLFNIFFQILALNSFVFFFIYAFFLVFMIPVTYCIPILLSTKEYKIFLHRSKNRNKKKMLLF